MDRRTIDCRWATTTDSFTRQRWQPTSRYEHLDIIHADASDSASLATAFAQCDVVINCIIDKTPGLVDQQLVKKNVEVTQAVLRACETAKVRRYIHVSSIVVLPPNVTPNNIQNPWTYSAEQDWYTQAKIQTEKVVHGYSGSVEISIVRPGIVYGPTDRLVTPRLQCQRTWCDGVANCGDGKHMPCRTH